MNARMTFERGEVVVDLSRAVSLAMPIDFSGREARHFGAPLPGTQPLAMPGFSGVVATGASCNCSTITLTPHCNGTHTECVGHLTGEPVQAHEVIPIGLLPALLLSIEPVSAAASSESTEPAPQKGDRLVTGAALEAAWPKSLPGSPRALVIRTSSARAASAGSTSPAQPMPPPYLSREAATLLVQRGIEHLVVDLPSIDRGEDEGRLTAHRVFFGLPRGSQTLSQAQRAHCTVTELARVPHELPDGFYLLELQTPAIGGDAVPTRPLLYRIQPS